MLATLKGNVGERFLGPNFLPSPTALLCTTFYPCSDIQLINAEIWGKNGGHAIRSICSTFVSTFLNPTKQATFSLQFEFGVNFSIRTKKL